MFTSFKGYKYKSRHKAQVLYLATASALMENFLQGCANKDANDWAL